MPQIEIAAKPRERITVKLVGKDYVIQTPKASLALSLAGQAEDLEKNPAKAIGAIETWATAAFGKSVWTQVKKRMNDPDDDLDITHIMELMVAVVGEQSGNPTT